MQDDGEYRHGEKNRRGKVQTPADFCKAARDSAVVPQLLIEIATHKFTVTGDKGRVETVRDQARLAHDGGEVPDNPGVRRVGVFRIRSNLDCGHRFTQW